MAQILDEIWAGCEEGMPQMMLDDYRTFIGQHVLYSTAPAARSEIGCQKKEKTAKAADADDLSGTMLRSLDPADYEDMASVINQG